MYLKTQSPEEAGSPWPSARFPPSHSVTPPPQQDKHRKQDGKGEGSGQKDCLTLTITGKIDLTWEECM